ncbi:MAG TPA: AI-2E family transporter [Acidiferrobacteraceae bacterium]|nr:AI-2E family transporter [Acidiferrobacteraceae bacterium]
MIELRSRVSVAVLAAIFLAAAYALVPYTAPLLMGVVMAVVGWPAQKWVEQRFHVPQWAAAFLHALVWLAIVVLPAWLIVSTVAANIGPLIPKWQAGQPIIHPPAALVRLPFIGYWLWSQVQAVDAHALLHYLGQHKHLVQDWLGVVWIFMLHTAIAAALVFILGLRGERVAAELTALAIRLWGTDGPAVLSIAARSAQAVMGGIVGVGIGEGLLIGLSFAVGQVPLWSIWMVATIVLSPIPFGSALVLMAAAGWLLLNGTWITALAIAVWGLAVIAAADMLLRPMVSTVSGNTSFLLMLLSILGGAKMFGLVGVVTGPILLGLAAGIWDRWFTLGPQAPTLPAPAETPHSRRT